MDSLGTPLPQSTIRKNAAEWLAARQVETARNTFTRYEGIMNDFLEYLGPKADRDLVTLSSSDISAYRDTLLKRVSPATVNNHLKVLRVWLEKAVKAGVFDRNPARMIDYVNDADKTERRPFSLPELKKMLGVASQDWKTAILVGLYTGLRLNDVANLGWNNISTNMEEVTIKTQKTKRIQRIPIAEALKRHLEALPASDSPSAPLCPGLRGKRVPWLSAQFYELMASVGLVESRKTHEATSGKGRAGKRGQSELSFHSLRHTCTSLLKSAGVSDAIAMDLVGHESAAVSAHYTHIDEKSKKAAVDKMPDVLRD
jgi:integrase